MAAPAQQRLGPHWQAGSVDAIYQSLNLIDHDGPTLWWWSGPIMCTGWTQRKWSASMQPGGGGHGGKGRKSQTNCTSPDLNTAVKK